METEMRFAIRPYDVDMAGIVSNIVYVRWLEDLRMELLRQFFPVRELLGQGLVPVVARTEINYRASLKFMDECTGRMRVTGVGRTSTTLGASFHNGRGEQVADATQTAVLISTETGRPTPLPRQLRELFEAVRAGSAP